MSKNYDQAGLLNDAANLQDYGLPERQILAAQAQTAATLALAYEQRTANLIALMAQMDLSAGTDEQIKKAYELAHQVEERVGL